MGYTHRMQLLIWLLDIIAAVVNENTISEELLTCPVTDKLVILSWWPMKNVLNVFFFNLLW